MKRILLLLFVLSWALPATAADTVNRIAAIVNNDIITTNELAAAVAPMATPGISDEQLMSLRAAALEQLITDRLIEQRIKELGLTVSDAELDDTILSVQERNNLTEEQLVAALADRGLTKETYREQIRKEILHYRLLGREVNQKVLVTSREVREYFDTHPEEFAAENKVSVSNLSFTLPEDATSEQRNELRAQAEKSRKRLTKGEDFATVLADQGDMASGGDMGELVLTDMAAPLQQAIKGLQAGQVSDIVDMNGQLHLFLVTATSDNKDAQFDEVRDQIEMKLEEQKSDQLFKEWARDMRKNAFIDIKI